MWCQQARWSVESVHTKNIVSILHLLVALARHFRWNFHLLSSWFWKSDFVVIGACNFGKKSCSPPGLLFDCQRTLSWTLWSWQKEKGWDQHVSVSIDHNYVCLQVLTHRVIAEELTSYYDEVGMRCERDAFDTLFDHAPDKLQVPRR